MIKIAVRPQTNGYYVKKTYVVRGRHAFGLSVALGTLFSVFCLLFGAARAVRARDIFFLFGFGFNLIVFFFASRRAFAEGHSATSNYLVYIHVQYV